MKHWYESTRTSTLTFGVWYFRRNFTQLESQQANISGTIVFAAQTPMAKNKNYDHVRNLREDTPFSQDARSPLSHSNREISIELIISAAERSRPNGQ